MASIVKRNNSYCVSIPTNTLMERKSRNGKPLPTLQMPKTVRKRSNTKNPLVPLWHPSVEL